MKKLEAVKKGDDWEVLIKEKNIYLAVTPEFIQRLAMIEGLNITKLTPGYIVATDGYEEVKDESYS